MAVQLQIDPPRIGQEGLNVCLGHIGKSDVFQSPLLLDAILEPVVLVDDLGPQLFGLAF